jgi:hypothetical protein
MRVATGRPRKTGKAAPKPLTTHQKQVVKRLLDAHGEDVQVGAARGLWLAAAARGPAAPRGGARERGARSRSGGLAGRSGAWRPWRRLAVPPFPDAPVAPQEAALARRRAA